MKLWRSACAPCPTFFASLVTPRFYLRPSSVLSKWTYSHQMMNRHLPNTMHLVLHYQRMWLCFFKVKVWGCLHQYEYSSGSNIYYVHLGAYRDTSNQGTRRRYGIGLGSRQNFSGHIYVASLCTRIVAISTYPRSSWHILSPLTVLLSRLIAVTRAAIALQCAFS